MCSADQNHLSQSHDNFRKPLRIISIKRSAKSESKIIDKKRLKLDETAQSSNAVVNDAIVESSSSKRKLSAIIQDNKSMECSSTDSRSKTPRTDERSRVLAASDPKGFQSVNNVATTSQQLPHRTTPQTANIRIPSSRQNSTHLSNPMYQTPELAHQRQMQPNQRDSQQQSQRPKLGIPTSTKPKDKKLMSTLQGVTKKILPPMQSNVPSLLPELLSSIKSLMNNPQLQVKMNPRSTLDTNVDFTTSPQNIIASETCDRQNTQMPSRSVYQPPRTQHTKAPENGYQKLCTQQELVDQCTRTSSKTKPVHFMDDAARTPVTGSHQNVTAIASQTDESMVKETLSLNHAGTLDSGAVIEISDSAMSTDVSPLDTASNDDVTINDSGCGSADKSTAAQNSTSTNHQTDTKVIFVQRMLDNFDILLTQMDFILHYTTQQ